MSTAEDSALSSASGSSRGKDPANGDLTGCLLGEFRLLRRLGRGGMADVYLAEQTSLRRQVAVKVLRAEFTTDAGYLKRFQQEASAAGTLNHPNIVQVYMIGQQEGHHYIAQEYVQGRNLKEFLARKGPLDVPVALVILRQVAAALQVSGSAGVVHRDIKPENILLTRRGEAKVADFGLAQLTLQGERVALTQVGVTMGTPLYMSPEQVNGKPLDSRSDLYSFGVMAYHMLAGKPPFQGDTALAIAVQHLNSHCTPLKKVRPDLPDDVCEFVHKLMAKKKEDRYPDAQAVLQELKQLSKSAAGKEPVDEKAFVTTSVATEKPRRRPRIQIDWDGSWRKSLVWLIPCCLLTAGTAAGAGWLLRIPDPFETPPTRKTGVDKQPTAQAQWFAAMRHDDEAHWAAVLEHYGNDADATLECNRAQLQLALIALRRDRDQAKQRFQDLVHEGQRQSDKWKVAHGTAGLALVAAREGNNVEFRILLDQVRNTKLDGSMKQALEDEQKRIEAGRPNG